MRCQEMMPKNPSSYDCDYVLGKVMERWKDGYLYITYGGNRIWNLDNAPYEWILLERDIEKEMRYQESIKEIWRKLDETKTIANIK